MEKEFKALVQRPPENSEVMVERDFDGYNILIPKVRRGWGDLFGAAFIGFWLCGWAAGETFAIAAIVKMPLSFVHLFLLGWLGGWTIGGIFAFRMLFKLIRGAPQEIISLAPFELKHKYEKTASYDKRKIGKFEFQADGVANALYFDCGADRVYLGGNLKEPEREWLYKVMKSWREYGD